MKDEKLSTVRTYFDCVFRVDNIEDVYAEYMEGTLKYIVITKLKKTSSWYGGTIIVTHQLLTRTQAAQKKYYTGKNRGRIVFTQKNLCLI